MMRTPHAQRLLYRTALAACLSGALALAGCVTRPVNTNAGDQDTSLRGKGVSSDEWDKQSKTAISSDTYYAAGQLAESRELWSRAIEQYDKALKINHDHLPSLFRLGVLYAKFKQYPQAITTWKHYLTATGGDPTGYANVGFCYELSGQFEEAENAYEAGIRRDPNSAPCRVNYGLMLARRGRFNQAMHEWQVVLPEAEVHYNLGSAYESSDRKTQARIEFHKALELDPQMADARARLEALGEKVPMSPKPVVAQISDIPQMQGASTEPTTPTTVPSATPAIAANPELRPDTMPVEEVEGPATAPSTQPVASVDAPTTEPTASTPAPTTSPVTGAPAGAHPEANVNEATPQN